MAGWDSRSLLFALFVIKDYFEQNQVYALADFLRRSRTALNIASDRVKEKYGFPCSRALGQLAKIEAAAARFPNTESKVTVLSFHDL